jgi:hypothetical protein
MRTEPDDVRRRARFSALDIARADAIIRMAWHSLPGTHRQLLEAIGASQWQVVNEPLGSAVDGFLQSGGHHALSRSDRISLDDALAVWISQLRIMVLDAGHELLESLDESAYERFVASTAWHEWGHALSMELCSPEDVAAGRRLLELAPKGVREVIRGGGYRSREYTHELVANVYALLMARRQRNVLEQPQWLDEEIYSLVMRVTGWTE